MLLFQLPPSFKKDLAVLDGFLDMLPPGVRAAFEFRHDSWHDPDVFDRLRARRLALCVADSERLTTPVEVTAPYGYFRLRDQGYERDDIARWADTIATACASCDEVFAYFKHEDEGRGQTLRDYCWMHSRCRSAEGMTGALASGVPCSRANATIRRSAQ